MKNLGFGQWALGPVWRLLSFLGTLLLTFLGLTAVTFFIVSVVSTSGGSPSAHTLMMSGLIGHPGCRG